MRVHKVLLFVLVFLAVYIAPSTSYAQNVVALSGINFMSNNVGNITLTPTLSATAPDATGVEYAYMVGPDGSWVIAGSSTNALTKFAFDWDTKDIYADFVYLRARTLPTGSWFMTDSFKVFNIFTGPVSGITSPATGVISLSTTIAPDPPYTFPNPFPEGLANYTMSSAYRLTGSNLTTPKSGTIDVIRTNFQAGTSTTGTVSLQFMMWPGPGSPGTTPIFTSSTYVVGIGLQAFNVNANNIPKDAFVGFSMQPATPSWNAVWTFYYVYYGGGQPMPSYGNLFYNPGTSGGSWYTTSYFNGPAIEFSMINPYTVPIEMRFGYKDGTNGTAHTIGVGTKNPDDTYSRNWNSAGFGSDRTYIGTAIRTGSGWNSWKWQGPYLVTNPANVSFTNNLGHGKITIDDIEHGVPFATTWNFLDTHLLSTPSLLDEKDDERQRFDNWNTGGDRIQYINFKMASPRNYIANYVKQYYLAISTPYGDLDSGTSLTGWYDTDALCRSSVPASFPIEDGVRFACIGWTGTGSIGNGTTNDTGNFVIAAPTVITWLWSRQYYFTVTTPQGVAFGAQSGWHNENATLISYVDSPVAIDVNNRWSCTGWTSAAIGNGTVSYTGEFQITSKTDIVWNWAKQFKLVGQTNLGTILPGKSWHYETTPYLRVELSAFSPGDTSEQRFTFLGWTGEEYGSGTPQPGDPIITVTMDRPKAYFAHWSAKYYLSVVAQNGSVNPPPSMPEGYDGWYDAGATLDVSVLPPAPEPGVRFVVGWAGSGIAEHDPTPGTPNPLPVTVSGPVSIFATWVRQFSLQIIDIQQVGISNPAPGTYWYFSGELVSGWTSFRTQGLISQGLIGTGSARSSTVPFFEFSMTEPSTVTWLWSAPDTMYPAPNWADSFDVALYANSGIAAYKRTADGSPVIAYFTEVDGSIRIAWLKNGFMRNDIVYTFAQKADAKVVYAGNDIAVDIDNRGIPHIVFYDPAKGVMHAAYTGTSWTVSGIDSTGDPGRFLSFAMGPGGVPHFAYYKADTGDLIYAVLRDNVLETQTVDELGNVGLFAALAVSDRSGLVRIAYYDASNGDMKCAIQYGNSWSIYTVDDSGDTGLECSIALDPSGAPIVAYQENNGAVLQGLKCAFFIDEIWQVYNLDSSNITGFGIDMQVDQYGNPLISYHNFTSLKYAYFNGLVWTTGTILQGELTGETSISLDASGNPGIVFWKGQTLSYVDSISNSYTGPFVVDDSIAQDNTAIPTGSVGGGGGCFVATAAFGAVNSNTVESLISFRDAELLSSKCSEALVNLYYINGTAVADGIAASNASRSVLRSLINRLVK